MITFHTNRDNQPLQKIIQKELKKLEKAQKGKFKVATGFLRHSGLNALNILPETIKPNIEYLFIVGIDLSNTDLQGLRTLLKIKKQHKNFTVKVFLTPERVVFHPKIYLFEAKTSTSTTYSAIVGSANLTSTALNENEEAVILVTEKDDPDIYYEIENYFKTLLMDTENAKDLTEEIIQEYQERLQRPRNTSQANTTTRQEQGTEIEDNPLITPQNFKEGYYYLVRFNIAPKCLIPVNITNYMKNEDLQQFIHNVDLGNENLGINHNQRENNVPFLKLQLTPEFKQALDNALTAIGKLYGHNETQRIGRLKADFFARGYFQKKYYHQVMERVYSLAKDLLDKEFRSKENLETTFGFYYVPEAQKENWLQKITAWQKLARLIRNNARKTFEHINAVEQTMKIIKTAMTNNNLKLNDFRMDLIEDHVKREIEKIDWNGEGITVKGFRQFY